MALPQPNKDETRDAFMQRFMADATAGEQWTDEKQRYVATISAWEKTHAVQRKIDAGTSELRLADEEAPKLVGYAAKYGIKTDIGWFIEKIRAGAFDDALETSDVRALKNHNPDLLLGRTSSGTLRLDTNNVGLRFAIDAPDTTTGRDTVEEVRRGDLAGCSFSFTVAEDEWKHFDDKPSERTIVKIGRLYDIGPVTFPAYEDTTVGVRSLEQFQQNQQSDIGAPEGVEGEETRGDAEGAAPDEITTERQREVGRQYRKAGRILNRCRADA